MRAPWLVLQLSDGAFPSGGFAHSAGLEAAAVLDGLGDGGVEAFLEASLRQLGSAHLPFVRAAALDPARLPELDEAFDATLLLRGPNLASRSQGRSFASATARVWESARPAADHAARGPAHHAPIFGAVLGLVGALPSEALAAYLHGAARGILSAGVRLGLLGPIEAQRILAERAGLLDRILAEGSERGVEDAAQTAPVVEIFAGLHERLDGRMFQS